MDYVQVPKDCPLSGDSMADGNVSPRSGKNSPNPLMRSRSKGAVEETKARVHRRLGKQMHVSSLSTDFPSDENRGTQSLILIKSCLNFTLKYIDKEASTVYMYFLCFCYYFNNYYKPIAVVIVASLAAKSGSESSLSEECENRFRLSEDEDKKSEKGTPIQSRKKEPDIQEEEKEKCSDDDDGTKKKDLDGPPQVVRRRRSSARNNAQVSILLVVPNPG